MKKVGIKIGASAVALLIFAQVGMASAQTIALDGINVKANDKQAETSAMAIAVKAIASIDNPGNQMFLNKESIITYQGNGVVNKLGNGVEAITYKLQCFGIKDTKITYKIVTKSNQTSVESINISFPDDSKREELMKNIVKQLGATYKEDSSVKDSIFAVQWRYQQLLYQFNEKKGHLTMDISPLGKLDVSNLPGVEKNLAEIQTSWIDLDKDGKKEQVIIAGKHYMDEKGESSSFMSNIYLITKAENKNPVITSMMKDADGGYAAEALFADMNNDGKKEILVSAPTGGSGGMIFYNLFTYDNGKPIHIFDSNIAEQEINMNTSKYVDGYKAELNVNASGKAYKAAIDLGDRKEVYQASKVYNSKGKLLEQVEPWGSYAQIAKFVPTEKNDFNDLVLSGRVNGTCNADDIADISIKLSLENGKVSVKDVSMTPLAADIQ